MVPDKQVLLNVPFQSTKYRKRELCVDNIKSIGDVYCPTCRKEKCVYNSTNKTTSFYDSKKCKACCHVLKILLGTKNRQLCCLVVMEHIVYTSRDYEKEKPSPFLKKFLHQSQPSTSEPELKKVKKSPNME